MTASSDNTIDEIISSSEIYIFKFSDHEKFVAAKILKDPPYGTESDPFYQVEIIVRSPFVSGGVRTSVSRSFLYDWGRCLDALADDRPVVWPPEDSSAYVEVSPDFPLEVNVVDGPSTQVSVRVPVQASLDDLIDEYRRLLNDALDKAEQISYY